jgi:DNA-binding transcriptional LysR family regulator
MTEDRVHLWQRRARRGGYNHYEETPLQTPIPTLTEFLPEPLSNFLTAHPQVNIDLEERLSDEIVAAVTDGTADVGIVAGSVGLETLPFRTDRFVLVVSPKHRLAGLDKVAFAETLDFNFVSLDRAIALQRFLAEKAERSGRRLKLWVL